MGHVLEHGPIFLQIYFKKLRKLHHIPFNLFLIQYDMCKQQVVNAWKESMEDSSKSQVGRVIEALKSWKILVLTFQMKEDLKIKLVICNNSKALKYKIIFSTRLG